MLQQEYPLNGLLPGWNGSAEDAQVQLYLQQPIPDRYAGQCLPCMVVFPGGGYGFTSDREAQPVALRFLALGYQVAVVRYSVAPHRFPTQLCEAALTLAWLRRNAQAFCIDPQRIAVCGFSAGGHLAASLSCLHAHPAVQAALSLAPGEARPSAAVLCYPVISGGAHAHEGSFQNLLGDADCPQLRESVSLENAVTPDTPPTFLWHTADDAAVPVENALLYAQALLHCKVPFALHIFPEGVHGLSLADASTATDPAHMAAVPTQWVGLCAQFLATHWPRA